MRCHWITGIQLWDYFSLICFLSAFSRHSLYMNKHTFDLLTPHLSLFPHSQGGEDLSDHVSGQRGVPWCGKHGLFIFPVGILNQMKIIQIYHCISEDGSLSRFEYLTSRFPTERRKSPYLRTWHLKESPLTSWTIQVPCNHCVLSPRCLLPTGGLSPGGA